MTIRYGCPNHSSIGTPCKTTKLEDQPYTSTIQGWRPLSGGTLYLVAPSKGWHPLLGGALYQLAPSIGWRPLSGGTLYWVADRGVRGKQVWVAPKSFHCTFRFGFPTAISRSHCIIIIITNKGLITRTSTLNLSSDWSIFADHISSITWGAYSPRAASRLVLRLHLICICKL